MRRRHASILSLLLAACGPGRVNAGDGSGEGETGPLDTSTGSETGASESTEPEPSDSGTDDSDPTTGWFPDFGCSSRGFWCTATCDMFWQDCPEGEKCTPYASTGGSWDNRKCVAVLGDREPGQACTYEGRVSANDDCDGSSMCYGGICQRFCTGTPDNPSCPPAHGCSGSGSLDDPLALCLALCDPLAQDCELGDCHWHNAQFLCNPAGEVAIGEPCGDFVNDCTTGSACVIGSALPSCRGSACCSPYCDLDQPDCSSFPGTECAAWFVPGEAPLGLERVGVCVAP